MFRLRRWYNQNRKKIWKAIIIIVFLIVLIQLLNYLVARNNTLDNSNTNLANNNSIIENTYTDLSVQSDKSVLSNKEMSTNQVDTLTVINEFFSYCNNKEIQKAYDMLTDECKQEMYPKVKDFQENYYKIVFNGEKKNVSIENWTGDTYKVGITSDFLSTGKYNSDTKQEYITVKDIGDNQYRLNINSYIGRKEINKSSDSISNIELTVESKDIFMDYEIYTFKIKNNTGNDILLDNLKDMNSMYLLGQNNLRYSAYTNEISLSELLIRPREDRRFKIKYYNKYGSSKRVESVVFSKVIMEYTSKLFLEDFYTFSDYRELKIDL